MGWFQQMLMAAFREKIKDMVVEASVKPFEKPLQENSGCLFAFLLALGLLGAIAFVMGLIDQIWLIAIVGLVEIGLVSYCVGYLKEEGKI